LVAVNHEAYLGRLTFIPLGILITFAAAAAEDVGNLELKAAIDALNRNARIVTLEDLHESAQAEFVGSSRPGIHPGFAAADFNGDKKIDYVVLLRAPGRKILEGWLVVFLREPKHRLRPVVLEKIIPLNDLVYIEVVPPGIARETDPDRKARLLYPGISRIYSEKSSTLFYWDKGRFRRIDTSD
jgi:hypothetical protein